MNNGIAGAHDEANALSLLDNPGGLVPPDALVPVAFLELCSEVLTRDALEPERRLVRAENLWRLLDAHVKAAGPSAPLAPIVHRLIIARLYQSPASVPVLAAMGAEMRAHLAARKH